MRTLIRFRQRMAAMATSNNHYVSPDITALPLVTVNGLETGKR